MSAFSDALESEPVTNYTPECMVVSWRRELSERDCADFDSAMSDRNVTTSRLHRAMRRVVENPYRGSLSTVQRHRTGGCMCGVK